MIRLQPDWVGELLGCWARHDWDDATSDLGFPSVSPMFSKRVGFSAETDLGGYSAAEVQAMAQAVEWLHGNRPDHWRALSREFRPWSRQTLAEKPGDHALVLEAGKLIAEFVDRLLD